MAEFNIHHDVSRLMNILGMSEDSTGLTKDEIAETFINSTTSEKKSSGAFLTKLGVQSNSDFRQIHEDLKSKNAIELDPAVNLLARISEDDTLKTFLRLHKVVRGKDSSRRPQRGGDTPMMSSKAKNETPKFMPSTPEIAVQSLCSSGSNGIKAISHSSHKKVEEHEIITGFKRTTIDSVKSTTTSSKTISNSLSNPQISPRKHISSSNMSIDTIASDVSKVSMRTSSSKVSKDERKRKTKSRNFYKSEWSFLSLDYCPVDWDLELNTDPLPTLNLGSFNVHEQERLLMKDLLKVLTGIEGCYIRLRSSEANGDKKVLSIDDSCDELLKTLSKRIINICPLYSNIIHFIDDNDCGLVNQSLAGAMRGIIKDYKTVIAQLEWHYQKDNLTLQKMCFFLQPFLKNMEILKHWCQNINGNKSRGGAVLSILHNKTVSFTGDEKRLEFCVHITRDTCVPYFAILERWMTEGLIIDTFEEFCIEDQSKHGVNSSIDAYWDIRYKMNSAKMPNFLSRFQEKILKTGKYLSVIRECGKVIKKPVSNAPPMVYSTDERTYEARIELAYQSASRQLLQLLIEDSDLIGHLKSIKHYFFMDQGDWMVQFMDIASKELSCEVYSIDELQLRALIELSIRTSVSKCDPNHENIGIELQSSSLLSEMFNVCCISDGQVMEDDKVLRGYESIALTYNVKWPLNIILSTCNIGRYQMLFRHLFLCKYVERQLEAVWKTNQYVKVLALKTAQNYAEAFSLTQKMLNFVQNLSYFMMVEVIEPNFQNFITKIDSHAHVDELSKEHTSFVEGCLEGCLLSQKNTTQLMITLLDLCVQFATFMKDNGKVASSYELQRNDQGVGKDEPMKVSKVTIREETSINGQVLSFEDEVRIHHDKFTSLFLGLLQEIQNLQADNFSGNINHILYRLDFNGYYDQIKNDAYDRGMIEGGLY